MVDQSHDVLRFALDGTRYELSRGQVEARLAKATPETIYTHGVRVNEIWFPVMQAFEVAIGCPRASFNSHTARRHLTALGFDVSGEIAARTDPLGAKESELQDAAEWFAEADVQAAVVSFLSGAGWRIVSTADTASKERGVDVVAEREGETIGIEVKGFPSRSYADPRRAAQKKPTSPSTQAGHWFAQAVLAAMRLRGKHPGWRSVIALPRFPRYENLLTETSGSLTAAGIEVWWVHPDSRVDPV